MLFQKARRTSSEVRRFRDTTKQIDRVFKPCSKAGSMNGQPVNAFYAGKNVLGRRGFR